MSDLPVLSNQLVNREPEKVYVCGGARFHKAGTVIAPHPRNCSHPKDLRTGWQRGTTVGELRSRGGERK